jgi:hypothetical protein
VTNETIEFSAAELDVLQERMKAYRESVNSVNEWIAFLTKQHKVSEADGWQLGETGFVRQVAAQEQEAQEARPWAEPVVVTPEPVVASNGTHGE